MSYCLPTPLIFRLAYFFQVMLCYKSYSGIQTTPNYTYPSVAYYLQQSAPRVAPASNIYIYIYILSEECQQYSATRRGNPPKRIATLLEPQTASLSFSLQLLANNHNGANAGISNSFKRRYTIIMKFHSMGNNYGQTYSRRAEIPAASHSKARLSHA